MRNAIRTIHPFRTLVVPALLTIALGSTTSGLCRLAAQSHKRMADGKQWTTGNLSINTAASYCYADAEPNCSRYGRLYTWESARRVCQSLGPEWRLPSDSEWRQLARLYGGVSADSEDGEYARLDCHGFYWTASEQVPGTAWPFSVRCLRDAHPR